MDGWVCGDYLFPQRLIITKLERQKTTETTTRNSQKFQHHKTALIMSPVETTHSAPYSSSSSLPLSLRV